MFINVFFIFFVKIPIFLVKCHFRSAAQLPKKQLTLQLSSKHFMFFKSKFAFLFSF